MEELRKRVKELLEKGEIDGFLGYRGSFPYLFTDPADLKDLEVPSERYPLPKILTSLFKRRPVGRFGVLVRGCEERGIIELVKNAKLEQDKVMMIGVACSKEQASNCRCSKPYPDVPVLYGEKVEGVQARDDIERIEAMEEGERLSFWLYEFSKCIKCYGCRNICPQCFCDTCTLEEGDLVKRGVLPPEVPAFHLVRAFHMAGRCIDCGLCEEACPANIPLRTLYRKVREGVKGLLGYEPGASWEEKEPLGYLGDGRYEIPERLI